MKSVELFAGAGGLAIGMAKAGVHHAAVLEWNSDACETSRENKRHHTHRVEEGPLPEGDVRGFDCRTLMGDVMVVSGGPPCQPFSMGGKHRGHMDERDMFPEAVRAVRELRMLQDRWEITDPERALQMDRACRFLMQQAPHR